MKGADDWKTLITFASNKINKIQIQNSVEAGSKILG